MSGGRGIKHYPLVLLAHQVYYLYKPVEYGGLLGAGGMVCGVQLPLYLGYYIYAETALHLLPDPVNIPFALYFRVYFYTVKICIKLSRFVPHLYLENLSQRMGRVGGQHQRFIALPCKV